MGERLICALIAVVVSVVANKILAVHTFKVLDGHIEDTFKEIGKFVSDIKELVRNTHINE